MLAQVIHFIIQGFHTACQFFDILFAGQIQLGWNCFQAAVEFLFNCFDHRNFFDCFFSAIQEIVHNFAGIVLYTLKKFLAVINNAVHGLASILSDIPDIPLGILDKVVKDFAGILS